MSEQVLFDLGRGQYSVDDVARSTVLARLRVYGIPRPQGSKVPFIDKRTGKPRIKEQGEVGHVEWRNAVAQEAFKVAEQLGAPLDGALVLEATFRFPVAQGRRRKAAQRGGMLPKESAPDTSKLVRCVEDAIESAGLIRNDARFAVVHAAKFEVLDVWTGVEITIRSVA